MKMHRLRLIVTALLAACLVPSVGCYPFTSDYYGPATYNQDSKGHSEASEPIAPSQPQHVGVDPALVVAGAAAAGLIGYAIGNHHDYYPAYYGPVYYRPHYAPRYYGPRYYR